jgi:hypothetical protein
MSTVHISRPARRLAAISATAFLVLASPAAANVLLNRSLHPGIAVDKTTSGSGAHLALTYYFYPDATCTGGCELDTGFISSLDGGNHWGAPTQLAGPTALSDIALTSQGPMVGDYISTSFVRGGDATTVFAVGASHTGTTFDEAMFSPASPLSIATASAATRAASSSGVQSPGGTGRGALLRAIRRS